MAHCSIEGTLCAKMGSFDGEVMLRFLFLAMNIVLLPFCYARG